MDPLDKMVRKLFPCESNGKKRSTTFGCQIQPLIIRRNVGLTLVSDSVKKKFSNCFILIRRICYKYTKLYFDLSSGKGGTLNM